MHKEMNIYIHTYIDRYSRLSYDGLASTEFEFDVLLVYFTDAKVEKNSLGIEIDDSKHV